MFLSNMLSVETGRPNFRPCCASKLNLRAVTDCRSKYVTFFVTCCVPLVIQHEQSRQNSKIGARLRKMLHVVHAKTRGPFMMTSREYSTAHMAFAHQGFL